MSRNDRTKKRPQALSGQLDLFGAAEAANAPERKSANDALPKTPTASASVNFAAPPAKPKQTAKIETPPQTAPSSIAANNNAPEKRPRGRPRKLTPTVTAPAITNADEARDRHAHALRDEWWNSQMVCEFLKISRKTLWERRRAKNLEFPKPNLLGGVRNLYRASAIRAWAERMADAEY